MSGGNSDNKVATIVVPLVVAVLGLVGVMMQTDWFSSIISRETPGSPPTATETVAAIPVDDPTETSPAVDATDTPVPLPLEEIFPQSGSGEDFDYLNNPAVFTGEIVSDSCVHSGVYGLKLVYEIKNSGSGGWGVLWSNTPAGVVDLTVHSELAFWVKSGGGSERFKVSFSDSLYNGKSVESTDLLVLSKE